MVVHPVSGVSSDIEELVAGFAADGYLTLAPDLYTHDPEFPQHSTENIYEAAHLGNQADREAHLAGFDEPRRNAILAAENWMRTRSRDPIDLVEAAFHYLHGRDDVSRVGSIGFCMGGRLTGTLAGRGVDLAAGVVFYGGSPKADVVANIRCPMDGHYGVTDRRITGGVYDFALAMNAAGKHFSYSVYNADHGFVHPPAHSHNPEAARLALERAGVFLERYVKRAE